MLGPDPLLAALLVDFLFLKCAAVESWRCQSKQTQPEPLNQGRPSKKKKKVPHGGKSFAFWHPNLREALQHILKPVDHRPFVSQHPIISAELATPEPAMVLIKEERVGLG